MFYCTFKTKIENDFVYVEIESSDIFPELKWYAYFNLRKFERKFK